MTNVPELEPHCSSWIITSKETGEVVFETFRRSVAECVNQEKYIVQTALTYLCGLNDG